MEAITKYLADCTPDGPVLGIKALRKIGKHVDAALLGPDDSLLLTELVRCLNAPGDELRLKELAMEMLARLSAKPQHIPLVQSALAELTEGFEAFFNMTTGLESDTVSRSLHVHTLTLFYRLSNFNLTGADMLELTTTIPSAVAALISIFLEQSLPRDLYVAAADTLMQLTLPDTYFADAKCTDMTDLERLTATYNEQVNVLMKEAMDSGLFSVLTGLLRPWIRHCSAVATRYSGGDKTSSSFLEPLHAVMAGVLKFIVNLLNYSTARGKKFRHHLAVDTDIISEVVLPYLLLVADSVNKAPVVSERDLEGLRRALMVLVVATFKIKTLRPYLRQNNIALRMLDVDRAVADGVVLALLVKLNINIDFAIPASTTPQRVSRKSRLARVEDDADAERLPSDTQLDANATKVVHKFRDAMRGLDAEGRDRLRKRLSSVDPAAPVNRSCRSYEVLSFTMNSLHFDIDRTSDSGEAAVSALMFDLPDMFESADTPATGGRLVGETPRLGRSALTMLSQWQRERETAGKRRRAPKRDGGPATPAEADEGPETGDSPATDEGPATDDGATSGPATPDSPATEPAGGVTAAAEDGAESGGAGAGAGAGAGSGGRRHRVMPMARARAPHHLRPMGAAGSSLPVPDLAKGLPPMRPAAGKRSLPSSGFLGKTSSVPVPAAHMCQLTKALMEDPVVTPSGLNFERSAIEEYLAMHGKCPTTGDALSIADLKPNSELKKEIQLFQFRRLMLSSRLR